MLERSDSGTRWVVGSLALLVGVLGGAITHVLVTETWDWGRFAAWLGAILAANGLLLGSLARLWPRLDPIQRSLVILWGLPTTWYWVMGPLLAFTTLYRDPVQLRSTALAYFIEVPLIAGGILVPLAWWWGRPLRQVLRGAAREAPERLAARVAAYPGRCLAALTLATVGGFALGALAQLLFAEGPLVEQVKLVGNGVVLSVFVGVAFLLALEPVLQPIRGRLRARFGGLRRRRRVRDRVFTVTMGITVGSVALIAVIGLSAFQAVVGDQMRSTLSWHVEWVQERWADASPNRRTALLEDLRTRYQGHAFLWQPSQGVPDLGLSLTTQRALKAGQRGVLDDYRGQVKLVAAADVAPDDVLVTVVPMGPYYAPMRVLAWPLLEMALFLLLLTPLLAAFASATVTRALTAMHASVRNVMSGGGWDSQVHTADEFEELSDALGWFVETSRELRHRLEGRNAELEQVAADLARSNKELEQFAYVTSHDLREPLRMIHSFSQLLEQRYEDRLDPEGLEFLAYVQDGAQRMEALISDLLAYSRVQRAPRRREPVPLQDLVDRVLHGMGPELAAAGAQVETGALPVVLGDEMHLERVLQNLVSNALKYRKPEVPLELRLHAERDQAPGFWRISVRDNGIGLDMAYRDEVFQLFRRLHARERYPGTGIGLTIVKQIVENHGGKVGVQSTEGEGADFWFTLPHAPPEGVRGGGPA